MSAYMAALRAPRRPILVLAVVLLGGLLPTGPVRAADPQTLQVSREITVTATDIAALTATIDPRPSVSTTVNFKVLDGPAVGPDKTCIVNPNSQEAPNSCSVDIRSGASGISLVRAWIDGTTPDTSEGRLAKKSVLGLDGDCTGDEAGFLGGGACEAGDAVPGAVAELDATDVVQIEWQNFTDGRLDCDDAKPSDGSDVEYNNAAVGDRNETYTCTLTTLTGAPIAGAYIDGEIVGTSTNSNLKSGAADYNDLCRTDTNGHCDTAALVTMPADGANTICFWAEPAKVKAFVKASLQGWKDTIANPKEAADIVGKHIKGLDADVVFQEIVIVNALVATPDARAKGLGTIDAKLMADSVDLIAKNTGADGKVAAKDTYDAGFLPQPRVHAIVAKQVRRQRLQGHRPVQARVVGKIDHAHAAAAEDAIDAIGADFGARFEQRRRLEEPFALLV